MTIARKRLVHPETTPYYHVICRCVRRAFLCGMDAQCRVSYEHRRQWVVDRLALLARVFAIDVAAYAVMSNHLHLVVRINPKKTGDWTDDEVMQRWSQIYGIHPVIAQAAKPGAGPATVAAASELVQVRRTRLSDLSWFMKCLNEHIARKSNLEDQCTGAFWEGRFKSQALLDKRALVACMAYVDLNPVRALMANAPEASDFTSVQQRIQGSHDSSIPLLSFQETGKEEEALPMRLPDYLSLVDWTGRVMVHGRRGQIPNGLLPVLQRLKFDETAWTDSMQLFQNAEIRALGPLHALQQLARALSRRWFRGSSRCKAVFGTRPLKAHG